MTRSISFHHLKSFFVTVYWWQVFQVFSPNGDEMFCTKAQADMPSVPLDVTDILPTLLASPASDSSQAQLQLQLQPHLHVHTLSDPPSFSNDSLSIVKALAGTLDDDYLDLKSGSGSDKSNLQIPSPEAMFRSWDSYGAFASSGDTGALNINISGVIGNGSMGGAGTHTHCTSAVSSGTYANNIINNTSHNNNSSNNNNNININLNTSKQPSSEKNVMYESVHDKSVLRTSAVWDPWKYGNTEPQRSFQLP